MNPNLEKYMFLLFWGGGQGNGGLEEVIFFTKNPNLKKI